MVYIKAESIVFRVAVMGIEIYNAVQVQGQPPIGMEVKCKRMGRGWQAKIIENS